MPNDNNAINSATNRLSEKWPWPFPDSRAENLTDENRSADDCYQFCKETGSITLKDQPQFEYIPVENAEISISLSRFEVLSNDGKHFIRGVGQIRDRRDFVGIIGSNEYASKEIEVDIFSESFLLEKNQNLPNRSMLGFSPGLEPYDAQDGSLATWFVVAYIKNEGIDYLTEASRHSFLNGVTIIISLSKNIYLRRGATGSTPKPYTNRLDPALYVLATIHPFDGDSEPYVSKGLSASVSTREKTVSFRCGVKCSETESVLMTELASIRKRVKMLETMLVSSAIVMSVYALAPKFLSLFSL